MVGDDFIHGRSPCGDLSVHLSPVHHPQATRAKHRVRFEVVRKKVQARVATRADVGKEVLQQLRQVRCAMVQATTEESVTVAAEHRVAI